ncbi:hypothetical protein AB0K66_05120 [Streptomyces werraensis]|uniref:hypothetical protein n=1 Tax=Streptomyces werraensis TaxID=68284 RepID=UPI003426C109
MDEPVAAESIAEDQPMLLTFLVALPHPCPMPHGAIIARHFTEELRGLQGVSMRMSPDMPDLPGEAATRLFVSLKFWQVNERAPVGDMHLDALSRVAVEVAGGEPFSPAEELEREVDSYRTVVEMITVQNADVWAADEQAAVNEALTRCFDVLSDVSSMARLVKHWGHPIATKEQVAVALWFGRPPTSPSYKTGIGGILMLTPPSDPVKEVFEEPEMNRLMAHLKRVWDGSPLELAMDRSLEASTFMRRDGDYGNAVIHAALSSEIVLDGVLALLLWEEQLQDPSVDAAIAAFDESRGGLATRVRREYAPRLGGTWDPEKRGAVQAWARDLARLRGRVVHRGYRPTETEAVAALSASDALLDFIKGRLAAKARNYPRTALLVLGEPGLRRLGGWKVAEAYLEASQHRPDDWFREYAAWRNKVDAAR